MPQKGVSLAKKNKRRKRLNNLSNVGAFFVSLLAIFCFTLIIVVGYVFINAVSVVAGDPVINIENVRDNQNQTSFLYATDSDGKQIEMLRLHGEENRIWVDFDQIPKQMKDAFIALEDKRFNDHHGVDWIRTIGVFIKQNDQGGSTITQQLVKNVTGNNEVTYVRKYNEILSALNLERNFSKDDILEAYLNTIYLGQGCYGVETAAETYFGKSVDELNVAECAVIAAITQWPYSYDPINNPDNNRVRQLYCLSEMLSQGKITKQEYDDAVAFDLIYTTDDDYVTSEAELERRENEKNAKTSSEFQSFYVDYVIDDVIERLQSDCGYSENEAREAIYGGGLRIYTAVDLDVQKTVEDVYVNRKGFADTKNAQSAITIMDYKGRVVAICGQAGEKEGNRVLNRASSSPRQPGSSIKPLTAYSPAIEEDEVTWSSYLLDYAVSYMGWRTHNANGTYGSGSNVTVQRALARSLNTISARLVINMVGIEKSYDYLVNKYHISTAVPESDKSAAPLSVGAMTYGATSLEMTAAYAAFGNGGYYYQPYSFYYIEDANGKVLVDNRNNKGEQVISTGTAEVMRHMLMTVTTSSYGTGGSYKVDGFQTFAKTGTTDDNYDKWFVGGTPYYVAAVWYGYDIPEAIYASGNPAGRVYKTVFDRIHENLEDKDFEDLDGAVEEYYCTETGKLASSSCYSTAAGWYKKDNLPEYCSGHYSSGSSYDDDDDDDDNDSHGTNTGGSSTVTQPAEPTPTAPTPDTNTEPQAPVE